MTKADPEAGRAPWRRFVWPALAGVLAAGWAVDHFRADLGWRLAKPRIPSERPLINNLWRTQQAAWNSGDLDEFMSSYWQSDQLTFYSGGTVTSGWQATLGRYHKKYRAEGKEMGTLTFDDVTVDLHGPDDAVARGRWGLAFEKSADRPHGLFTLVLKRFPDGWKIVHDHTSVAEPPKTPE